MPRPCQHPRTPGRKGLRLAVLVVLVALIGASSSSAATVAPTPQPAHPPYPQLELRLPRSFRAALRADLAPRAAGGRSFYWYSPRAITSTTYCWQNGEPPSSPSYSCNATRGGYQYFSGGAHTWADPNGQNAYNNLAAGVDYCAYYGISPTFFASQSTDLGPWTNFTTPTPHSAYQYGSGGPFPTCQFGPDPADSNAGTWGFEIAPTGSSGYCVDNYAQDSGCGMFHLSDDPNMTNRPWASTFTDPQLNLEGAWGVHTVGSGDWHGQICVQLADTTVGYQGLLYCLEPWRSDGRTCDINGPNCITYDSTINNVPEDPTAFGGMNVNEQIPDEYGYATPKPWSETTQHGTTGLWGFGITISGPELQTLISSVNAYIDTTHPGTLSDYSTSPADYALTGITCGMEGGSGTFVPSLGGECSTMLAFTTY